MSLQWKDGSGRRTETYRPGQATSKPDPSFGTPYGQPLGDAVSFGGDWNEWLKRRQQPPAPEPPAPEQQPYQQVPMSHWWQGQSASPYGGYYYNQPAQFPYWGGWWSGGQ